MNLYNIINYF